MNRNPSRIVRAAARSATPAAAKQQLMLATRRAQPRAVYIARLTGTAVCAYLLALLLPDTSARPTLAPLTALLVVQATLFQTIHSAVKRVLAVTAGVLAAVALAEYVGFSWWVLGLLTAGALALGMLLRLGNEILEVPISAMLIFATGSHSAATSRVLDTLVGAVAGLAAGLLFAPVRVQPAKEAVAGLTRQMAELLGQMATGLAEVPSPRQATEWLERTRALRTEVERLDEALGQAEDSIRLNPRRFLIPNPGDGLREGVDRMERAAVDLRVLSRAVADSAHIEGDDSPVRDAQTRAKLAAVLGELSAAVRAYGEVVHSSDELVTGLAAVVPEQPTAAGAELREHLAEVHRRREQLADALLTGPSEQPEGWQLRGEILAHVDRLRSELEPRRPPERTDTTGPLRAVGRRGRVRRRRTSRR
jgi:gas vesicle protein